MGDVDAGHRAGGDSPGRRYRPIACIHLAGRRIGHRRRLILRARLIDRRNQPGAVSLIITKAINVDPPVCRARIDFEIDRRTMVDADVGCEALKRR